MMNPVLSARLARRHSPIQTSIHEQDGRIIIAQSQDCTGIAEFAKEQHNLGNHGSSEMRHAARIPNVIIEMYCNENTVTFADVMRDPAHMNRICNDPENKMFRIWPGKL